MTKIQTLVDQLQAGHQTKSIINDVVKKGICNTFSEASRRTIKELGSIALYELGEISKTVPGIFKRRNILCLRQNETRKIKNRFEIMSNPLYSIKEDDSRGPRHGPQQWQYDHWKAKDATGRLRRGYDSIVDRWLKDKRYQESLTNRVCSLWSFTTRRIQGRCHIEMILQLQPDHLLFSGTMSKAKTARWKAAIRTWTAQLELLDNSWIAGVIFTFDNLVGTSRMTRTTWKARATRQAWMAGMARMSTATLSRQSFCKILAHSQFFLKFRVQTLANVVHGTECEDRTPHRTHMTRHRRTIFSCFRTRDSCAPFTNVTSLAREWVSILRFLKSRLVVTCFVVICLVFLIFSFSFRPRHLRHNPRCKRE